MSKDLVVRAEDRQAALESLDEIADLYEQVYAEPPYNAADKYSRTRFLQRTRGTFGEIRRRAKVIGRLPGETSCISIVWAVSDRASRGRRGLTMTPAGLRQLQDLRCSLLDPPRRLRSRHATPLHPADRQTVTATA